MDNAAESSPSFQFLSNIAKELKIYLIGGSIPEKDANGKIYNTSLSFGRDGELLGKFRKMHLFDIDIPGKITFKESETLSPGDSFCTLDTGIYSILIINFFIIWKLFYGQIEYLRINIDNDYEKNIVKLEWEFVMM